MGKKVILDLRNDIPQDVGYIIPGKFQKRYYSVEDIPVLLDVIASRMNMLRTEPGELELFDVIIFGNIQASIFGRISVNLSRWDDVESLVYIRPGDEPVRIFPE